MLNLATILIWQLKIVYLFFIFFSDVFNIHDGPRDKVSKSILHPGCVEKSRKTEPLILDRVAFFEKNCQESQSSELPYSKNSFGSSEQLRDNTWTVALVKPFYWNIVLDPDRLC